MKSLFVRTEWDEEAKVWVATSNDVPGLATEADTTEALVEKFKKRWRKPDQVPPHRERGAEASQAPKAVLNSDGARCLLVAGVAPAGGRPSPSN